jgi:hypothetical protein
MEMTKIGCGILLILLVSCVPKKHKRLKGFASIGIDYKGNMQPKVLKQYSPRIDTLVKTTLEKEYDEDFSMDLLVSRSLIIDDEYTAHLDTMYYTVAAEAFRDGRKLDRWHFMINRHFKVIGYQKIE